ncbi:hypothetical protein ACQ4PT_001180 [Festuca glaucescens]
MAARDGASSEAVGSKPLAPGSGGGAESIEEMVGRLKLTAAETRKIRIDDREEGDGPSWAVAGLILVQKPKVIHIQTISAALRPAWGNPKGLIFSEGGHNMFIAEFACERDRERMWERSPWTVNKHAVLLENYQSCRRPSELRFERLLLWVRVIDLPRNMINTNWGTKIANDLGNEVVQIDTRNKFNGFLRVRVYINVQEPLRRWIAIDSTLREACDWYEVQYENLPYFCFSCGLLGHSAVTCPTPADRDDNGEWPYGTRLRVPDERKKQASASAAESGTSKPPDEEGAQNQANGKQHARYDGAEVNLQNTLMGRGRGRGRHTDRGGHTNRVYRKLPMDSEETFSEPMDTTGTMVVYEGNAGANKRDTRPVQPPNSEKASPDPKKKKVSPSSEGGSDVSASAVNQPRLDQ